MAATGLGVVLSGRIRASGAVVFAYHDVGERGGQFTRFSVTPSRFRSQLERATEWGLRFVPLAKMVDDFIAGRDLRGLAAIVFDDCLVGVHRSAAPILADLGVPSTLFAVVGALGSTPPWWPGSAAVMTEAELRELADAGCAVQAHTVSHPSLLGLRGPNLDDEVRGSRERLEDLLQRRVDLFSYPFGHHDEVVRDAVRSAGYRAAFTFLNGRITTPMDPLRLPRLNMRQSLRGVRLACHLSRAPESWPDTQLDTVRHEP